MMFGIKALHEVKIVHSDLKPDNLILIPDATIGMGYKLRIIDLDWALLSDKQAPWHGKQGYVGTPGYMSPEHIQGKTPSHASDIFTCGIILSEILNGEHPYKDHSDETYNEAVLRGAFTPIKLKQSIDKLENHLFLESVLNACLDPEPSNRPTAVQVCDALMGKVFESRFFDASKLLDTKVEDKDLPLPESVPTDSKKHAGLVSIFLDGNKIYSIGHDAELGKQNFKNIHSDSQFLSNPQFKIFKKSPGTWAIQHISSATNETIVNGKKLDGFIDILDGMTVAVGNSSKGIHKLSLTLKLT
jgi:serine/threonine protein kinase